MLKIKKVVIFKNGRYFDFKTKTFVKEDIAVQNGIIINIGQNLKGDVERDITGQVVTPGFMDGHCHIESSNAIPYTFAQTVVKHGTTTVTIDPHEAVNVGGLQALEWFYQATENLPVDFFIGLPSCVPASKFDMQNIKFGSEEMRYIYEHKDRFPRIIALAEVMDFQGLKEKNEDLLKRIELAKQHGYIIDGHAPGIRGENFRFYIRQSHATSNHECFTYEEALENLRIADEETLIKLQEVLRKLKIEDYENYEIIIQDLKSCKSAQAKLKRAEELGLIKRFRIMIREAGAAKNLEALVPLFQHEEYKDRLLFVLDDKEIEELDEEGHMDLMIRKAISLGVKPEDAYMAATANTANYFNLGDRGEITIGKRADFVLLGFERENDGRTEDERIRDAVNGVQIQAVYKNGQEIYKNGQEEIINNWERPVISEELEYAAKHTMNFPKDEQGNIIEIKPEDLNITGIPRQSIKAIPYQILTEKGPICTNYDLDNDVIKVMVMDSHNSTGKKQITYLIGLGLKEGALASSIAHDSHPLNSIGTNDYDMAMAINEVIKNRGGQAFVINGKVIAILQFDYWNLMSSKSVPEIKKAREPLKNIKVNNGMSITATSAFLFLAVISKVRMTPEGIVDVETGKFITQEEMIEEYNRQIRKLGATQSDSEER